MSGSKTIGVWTRAGLEFIVIVVGVLVALGLEGWASDRAAREVELRFLTSLSSDLRRDVNDLADVFMPNNVLAGAAIASIAPVVRGEKPIPTDTIAFLQQVDISSASYRRLGRNPTFDEMVQTGSLGLIESPDVRGALVGYYQAKALTEDLTEGRRNVYPDLIDGYLPPVSTAFRPARDPVREREAWEPLIRQYGVRYAVDAIRTPEFREAMNRHALVLNVIRSRFEFLQDGAEALIPVVDAEIDRLR